MDSAPVGEIRPSQLIWTYGPGSMIDLPNVSVTLMGTHIWEKDKCILIREPRLLANVQKVLGKQVETLRIPPLKESDISDPYSPASFIGVPVKPFPRWLRCVKCGLLSSIDKGLFEFQSNYYRPHLSRFFHKGCKGLNNNLKPSNADAVPSRFLLACKSGHLDDFPWDWYVHNGKSNCPGTLRFFEKGASLLTDSLWVKCDECGVSRNMGQAFQSGRNLPACRGRHPHLNSFETDCKDETHAILLGATNTWFPLTQTVLAIPQETNPLSQLISECWDIFEEIQTKSEFSAVLRALIKTAPIPGIENFLEDEIWNAINSRRNKGIEQPVGDLKAPEWQALTAKNPPNDRSNFLSREVEIPNSFRFQLSRVLLLERLREVNALIGFTRVEPPDEENENEVKRAPLSRFKPDWVPASQTFGEGIFMQFNSKALQEWAKNPSVKKIDQRLQDGNNSWRIKRRLQPNQGYPGIRYVLLHTIAHLLIRELSLECGYNAASIRERIYADTIGRNDQAGIIIYTAAADSDGTLGGLVEMGNPENLERLFRMALERAKICSSDPLCSEHDSTKDSSQHGASCHACSFVSETSCEKANKFLDRSLVIPTFNDLDSAFFHDF